MYDEKQFTSSAQNALKKAQAFAAAYGRENCPDACLLCGIAAEDVSVGAAILLKHGICAEELSERLKASSYTEKNVQSEVITFLRKAVLAANRCGCPAGTAHLLSVLLEKEAEGARTLLKECGADLIQIKESCAAELRALESVFSGRKPTAARMPRELTLYTTDLTALAREEKLDPLIGREEEVEEVLSVLARRTKNNPCLLGEPGVGKTAIAEGVAQQFAAGHAGRFSGRRVLSLNLGAMLAGAKYRGDFEERLVRMIKQAEAEQAVLFIDEVHSIVGAGSSEGSTDCANLLKPVLARGSIQIIGATTETEYRKYIEPDAALARRFQPVTVHEPDKSTADNILFGLRPALEKYHHVRIMDEAVKKAVELSIRYLPERRLPDKAIDLLDEACSRASILSDQKDSTDDMLTAFIQKGDFAEAAALYAKTVSENSAPVISGSNISVILEKKTGIPVSDQCAPIGKAKELLAHLDCNLFGQPEVKKALFRAVLQYQTHTEEADGATASFLFCGPTGVGKTLAAKLTAEVLFDSKSFIRIDLSEYSEAHTVSRLIGAPPGYVGFSESGFLVNKVRRRPYSLLLFDEADKAHPNVLRLLLQILEDGKLTDSAGHTADFSNTMIVLTANLQEQGGQTGFLSEQTQPDIRRSLSGVFPSELLNRFDYVIPFKPLDKEGRRRIAEKMMREFVCRMERLGVRVTVSEDIFEYLSSLPECRYFGARPIRRFIKQELESDVILRLAEDEQFQGELRILLQNGKAVCEPACLLKNIG